MPDDDQRGEGGRIPTLTSALSDEERAKIRARAAEAGLQLDDARGAVSDPHGVVEVELPESSEPPTAERPAADQGAVRLGAVVRGGAAATLQQDQQTNPLKQTLTSPTDPVEVEQARREAAKARRAVRVERSDLNITLRSQVDQDALRAKVDWLDDDEQPVKVESAHADRAGTDCRPAPVAAPREHTPAGAPPTVPDAEPGSIDPVTIPREQVSGPAAQAARSDDAVPAAPAPKPDGVPARQQRSRSGLWFRVLIVLVFAAIAVILLARWLRAVP